MPVAETPSIGVEDYYQLPAPLFREFNEWLEREGLTGEGLIWLRLLEGAVEAERYVTDENGKLVVHGREVQREMRVYPITTAPPREALS